MIEQIPNDSKLIMDARHYISNVLVEEINRFNDGKVSNEQFMYLVDALERQSFLECHRKFFENVRKLATESKKDVDLNEYPAIM